MDASLFVYSYMMAEDCADDEDNKASISELWKAFEEEISMSINIIYNYSSKRAILQGLPSFPLFTQIKSMLLERLIASPLCEYYISLDIFEKFSQCLCEGLRNMTPLDIFFQY